MRWRDGKSEDIKVSIVINSEVYLKSGANAGLFRRAFCERTGSGRQTCTKPDE